MLSYEGHSSSTALVNAHYKQRFSFVTLYLFQMHTPCSSLLARWYYLLKYHRVDQIWLRAQKLVTSRLFSQLFTAHLRQLSSEAAIKDDLAPLYTTGMRRASRSPHAVTNLHVPEFSFLNQTRILGWPIDWRCQSIEPVSHLWQFQLHYQDALWPLITSDVDLLWKHVLDWAIAHELPTRTSINDGWHPFCLSRRLANWLQWWAISPPPEKDRAQLLRSIAAQTAYLSENLEWDLRGNHLLFNLWAIGLASTMFDGELGAHCLFIIDRYLPEQLEEQIIDGGEHFERATAYHIEAAELLLDLRDALKVQRPRLAAQCGAIAVQMTNLVDAISHPDGDPPLFGDSTLHIRPILQSLRQALQSSLDSPSSSAPRAQMHGDYWVWRNRNDCLIFDTGSVGADELPAHAHCDLLGFEASISGHKLFIDSGVFSYEDDENRAWCRSTAGHNCLEVDGLSQCDVWGKFRMGFRGHPELIGEGQSDGSWWCQASHNAYRRVGVPMVSRQFTCNVEGDWVCQDILWGSGEHDLISRLHLHPDVRVVELTSPEVTLEVGGQQIRIVFEGAGGELTTSTGRYCPEFGLVIPNIVLEYRRRTKVPAVIKWTLKKIAKEAHDSSRSGNRWLSEEWIA